MNHHQDFAAQLKEAVTMPMLIEYLGFEPNRSGYICCPFHGEKTPSMKIWDDHYKCFGCGAYGDIISFTQKMHNVDFAKAVEMLNDIFEVGLPLKQKMTLSEIRSIRQAKRRRNKEKSLRNRIEEQYRALNNLWATFDRIITDHPVPDNEQTAAAYRNRQYVGYLIDNFNHKEGYPDELFIRSRRVQTR